MNLKFNLIVRRRLFTVFLFSLICALPLQAWQGSGNVQTDSSGRIVISTHDSHGQLVSLTDGEGNKAYPDGSPVFKTRNAVKPPEISPASTLPQAVATIIHVPADQPTIQAAINAANSGDTVLVADGTYRENINFNGKAITVTSVNGPSSTTIDGGAVDSVVTFRTNETSNSVLNGFTITNGFSNFSKPNFGDGGGVFIARSSPVVTNNIITKNQACEGVGIFINGGSALIQGNTISLNTAAGCSGGIGGGGIAILAPSTPQIIGNSITDNTMTVSGLNGGGLSLFAAGSPVIANNIINNNMLLGIAMVNGSTPQMIQNLITNNTGGGLSTSAGGTGIVLINNTFAENFGESSFIASFGTGSAISGSFPSDAVLQNNLIIGKEGQVALFCTFTLPAGFNSNDVFSSGASAYSGCGTPPTGNNGNISADPLFVDVAVNDFHLQTGSPGIDAGNNNTPIALSATDADGNPRIVNTTVDMGAFEYQGLTTTNFSATSLTFAAQKTGTSSPPQTVTINNTGSVALHVTPFSVTGDFSETDTCHTSHGIAAGSSCTISITFQPTLRGTRTGQIVVTSNDSASPVTIQLSGTGLAPIANLSAPSLSFSSQLVNTTSAAQQFTLSNTGDASLTITSITASGDFAQTNNCGISVAPSGSCTVNVTFTPTLRGVRNGAVTITDDANGSPHSVVLQGTGIGPAATLSAGSITFPPQLAGTASAVQSVTLSSNGETALAITNISTTGDFTQTNNCGNSVPSGQQCTIQITFTPSARGTRNGTLSVVDNSTTSPEHASLSGMGTGPVASLSRTAIAFGNQVLNVAVTNTVTLTNTGDAALGITSIGATGDFSETDDCGTSLAAQAHCTVTIKFQPSAVGARIGTLTFTDSALNSPQLVSLTGMGVQLGFSSSNIAFGNQFVGTSGAAQAVTVTNLSNSALTLTSIVAGAGFTQTNNCGTSLAGNSSCIINIVFTPVAAGPVNGLITISYGGTQSTIIVSGNGTDFNLGPQQGGSTAATVAAGGTATYNLSISGTSGASGSVNLSCSGAPAAATCTINPTSITLNGTTAANFSVTVSTTSRASVFTFSRRPRPGSPLGLGLFLLTAIAASVMVLLRGSLGFGRTRLRYAGLAAFGLALLMFAGCGGGGSNTPLPQQHGTPAGTSTIMVTATSGSATRNLNLTLTVN